MKDYRTWWRKGWDVAVLIETYYRPYDYGEIEGENEDCFKEQLWAEREKIA